MSTITEMLKQAEQVKPISTTKDGVKIVSYEDAAILAQKDFVEGVDLGDREMNPDGTIAKSRVTVLAVNPERRTANRYRVKGKQGGGKVMQVVIDGRAIDEQKTGRVYLAQLPCYELERVKGEGDDKGEIVLRKMTYVTREEFVSSFTGSLSVEAMYEVNAAIAKGIDGDATKEVGIDEMPI